MKQRCRATLRILPLGFQIRCSFWFWMGVGALFSGALAGCDSAARDPGGGSTVSSAATAPDGSSAMAGVSGSLGEVSEEEASAFAGRWVTAIYDNDLASANQLVDWGGILDRAIEGFEVSDRFRKQYRQGAMKNGGLGAQMVGQLQPALGNGGTYTLLRVVPRNGETHAVFRLIDPMNGLNYHDLRIVRHGEQIVADRFYVSATGEELATTMRTAIGPAMQSRSSVMARMSGRAKAELDRLSKQAAVMRAAKSGQVEEAQRLFDDLPEESKNAKLVLFAMILATASADEETYLAAIDRFAEHHPEDPALAMLTFDAAVMRGDIEMLEQAKRYVEDWTGGDPYFDVMVASSYVAMGQLERAAEVAAAVDPDTIDVADGHDILVGVGLAIEDYQMVLDNLVVLRDEYDYQFTDLRESEDFAGFVNSPQFQQWQ
jgi:hypothetical protein